MSSPSIDYAAFFGIRSVAGAAIFAVLYLPLACWFVRQSIKNTTYVYIMLTGFCLMRETAFIIRLIMAKSISEGSNLNVFIADQILFGIGFFALLYSVYTLSLDRNILAGGKRASITSLNPFRNTRLFRMALTGGVVVGIIATINSASSKASDVSLGLTLRKVSTVIFFVLTAVQVAQTAWFFKDDSNGSSKRAWGDRNGRYLLCLVSLLIFIREMFLLATVNNATRQNDERFWYPFVAIPEFLAVLCYSVSGLVPTRAALKAADDETETVRLNSHKQNNI